MNRTNFFSAGNAEGSDADADILHFPEGVAAADEGGASGEHVVDEEDVATFELLGMTDAEGTLDIALAVGGAGAALLAGVAVTDKGFGVHLTLHHLGDTATEQLALVVTALEAPPPVEGLSLIHI